MGQNFNLNFYKGKVYYISVIVGQLWNILETYHVTDHSSKPYNTVGDKKK